MAEHEKELPASKVVEQFGAEIRAAIAAVEADAPTVAKQAAASAVKTEARKSAIRWYTVSLIMSLAVSMSVTYFMLIFASHWHAVDLNFHRGSSVETCTRTSDSPASHPAYICRTH